MLVAVFLMPLGFAVESVSRQAAGDGADNTIFNGNIFPPLLLSGICISILFLLLLWVTLSVWDMFFASLCPWSFSGTTIWLGKCCIAQWTNETIAAGCGGFKKFL